MAITRETLSLGEARRVALGAQGLHRPSVVATPGLGPAALARSVAGRGLLQIDSIQVLARAHLVPTYSRHGAYDVAALERASGRGPRRLVETWAHEASIVPVSTYPLLAVRRRRAEEYAWGGISSVARTHPEVVTRVLELVGELGPVTAAGVQAAIEHEHPRGARTEWGWNWSVAKRCLELLLTTGGACRPRSSRRSRTTRRACVASSRSVRVPTASAPRPASATTSDCADLSSTRRSRSSSPTARCDP